MCPCQGTTLGPCPLPSGCVLSDFTIFLLTQHSAPPLASSSIKCPLLELPVTACCHGNDCIANKGPSVNDGDGQRGREGREKGAVVGVSRRRRVCREGWRQHGGVGAGEGPPKPRAETPWWINLSSESMRCLSPRHRETNAVQPNLNCSNQHGWPFYFC